jgi:aryl-alcohol dehydrogenase-like predicted oxidoreductase
MAKPTITAAIASATSMPQLAELLASLQLQLTPDQIARLDAASA